MKIKIRTNQTKYFRQVLEFMSPLPPFDSLSNREKDVLSQLLMHNYQVIELPKDERDAYVFSKITKEKIRRTLDISKPSFDNQMAALRRKGFISYVSIFPKFELKSMDEELTFVFNHI